jgi:alpha-L-arabinofuranosidase
MGEYAAQSIDICAPDNRNNLRCALAEAAFLTGVERNSDVVVMSSYAPLFGHEEAWQWRPNLIWFDNLTSYVTPNYYVQQLFSLHRPDVVLPVELNDSRPPRPAAGGIGLVTNGSSAEFDEVRVTKNGEVAFDGAPITGPGEMIQFRGNWQVADGVIRQADQRATARAHFGDPAWQDYTLTLKARKLAGGDGFGVVFRNSDGGSYLQWNLGSDRNTQHRLEARPASHSVDDATVDRAEGSLEENRWYDLKVEVEGAQVRCYLDGKLTHDLEIPPPALPRLFAAAGRDDSTGQIILKIVNPTDDSISVAIDLAGLSGVGSTVPAIVLAGEPGDENSIAEPEHIAPREESLTIAGPRFEHTFAPNSLTILKIDAK